jgi:phytol kinase
MIAPGDLRGALILSAVFLFLLALAEAWRRLGQPKAEWTRKLVHVAGGIVCLLFPFLIRSPWVVLAMALALTGIFSLAAHTGALRSLHAVERRSRGVEYYPLAVWLVFLLTADRPWLYLSAILVLAVGDAFAALVGGKYGVLRYEVEDEHKSLEGSLVFLVVAFLAIHLPTLLLTDLPRATCVLAALLVAVLVTGFEAISLGGLDNVFVPLAVVIVLDKITSKPLPEIVFQNLSLAVIIVVVAVLVARVSFFNVGGAITIILYAYGTWSLGSWHWALPVFAGLICYLVLWVRVASPDRAPRLKVRVVARALLVPFLFLAVANGTGRHDVLFGPYLAASACVLVFSLATPLFRLTTLRGWQFAMGILGVTSIGCGVAVLPAWLVQADVPGSAPMTAVAVLLPATFLLVLLEGRKEAPGTPQWTATRFLMSAGVGGVVLALQSFGLTAGWNPF